MKFKVVDKFAGGLKFQVKDQKMTLEEALCDRISKYQCNVNPSVAKDSTLQTLKQFGER